ncbi:hypothetical protein T439DRAFT_375920 [Meredithblackwellia eburnea MCA 4105]
MPNQAGINFNNPYGPATTSSGQNANDVYHGHRGVTMNPQTSESAKFSSGQTMNSFQDAARNTAAGFNGVMHNPQSSEGAKAHAEAKLNNMPKW